jgi:hypothetical protein
MKRTLLALTMCALAAPAHAITASVATSPSGGPPAAPGSAARGSAANVESAGVNANSAAGKSAPSPTSVTRPANVLSAPGVPMKATPATSSKAGVAPSKSSVFMPNGTSPSGVVAPPPNSAGWTAAARGGPGMRRGTMEAVNVNPGTFQVFGQKHSFNPQQVKVFNRDGRPGNIYGLKNGAKVRFTLDPKDPAQRRVAVIYME